MRVIDLEKLAHDFRRCKRLTVPVISVQFRRIEHCYIPQILS